MVEVTKTVPLEKLVWLYRKDPDNGVPQSRAVVDAGIMAVNVWCSFILF